MAITRVSNLNRRKNIRKADEENRLLAATHAL